MNPKLVCFLSFKAHCVVVCEELVTGFFVVVIVRVVCFFSFVCFEKEMEKSKNKRKVEQLHSSVLQRLKAS